MVFSFWMLPNIGLKLGLIFFSGNALLAKQCISGMLATVAGIGLTLLFFVCRSSDKMLPEFKKIPHYIWYDKSYTDKPDVISDKLNEFKVQLIF
ncbi:hypothetical protein [Nitrosomonas sp.]|uniref:hypothetical protein n=1 Tax=Nitrosomonas sp. TaxID=42353 RepID=UPI002735B234|nr:hypothetical protein [Nitrosomonas sp.]